MRPVLSSDGTYKIGTWVREDTQGIGTLTYVTKTGEFGTLGHGITDVDTGTLLNLHGGELFQTQIVDIMKGEKGNPGSVRSKTQRGAATTMRVTDHKGEADVRNPKKPFTAYVFRFVHAPLERQTASRGTLRNRQAGA